MTFKVGDRVRLTRGFGHLLKGHAGTIGKRGEFTGALGFTYVDVVWDQPCRQGDGGYYPEMVEKIGERRVGWRVDYPVDDVDYPDDPGRLASIFDSEEEANLRWIDHETLGAPVRIEYDVAVPPVSKPVKVGDRVSVYGIDDGTVVGIDNNKDSVWIRYDRDIWTAHLTARNAFKVLDDDTGKYSYAIYGTPPVR